MADAPCSQEIPGSAGRRVRLAISLWLAPLLAYPAWSQQVAFSLTAGTGAPGSTVTLSLSMTASGGAQPASLQWRIGYPSDVTSVAVNAGTALTAAGKSVTCFSSGGSTTCVA